MNKTFLVIRQGFVFWIAIYINLTEALSCHFCLSYMTFCLGPNNILVADAGIGYIVESSQLQFLSCSCVFLVSLKKLIILRGYILVSLCSSTLLLLISIRCCISVSAGSSVPSRLPCMLTCSLLLHLADGRTIGPTGTKQSIPLLIKSTRNLCCSNW